MKIVLSGYQQDNQVNINNVLTLSLVLILAPHQLPQQETGIIGVLLKVSRLLNRNEWLIYDQIDKPYAILTLVLRKLMLINRCKSSC